VTPVAGGPKLVNVAFNIGEGPKLRIRDIEFVGNQAFSDRTLARKMKDNKAKKGLIFMHTVPQRHLQGRQVRRDAEKVAAVLPRAGLRARACRQPGSERCVEDEQDGKTRWIQLRIPVTEGPRYRVGDFKFEGNTVVKSENLRPMFKLSRASGTARRKFATA
jgi:outer membrane protein insertion porin family